MNVLFGDGGAAIYRASAVNPLDPAIYNSLWLPERLRLVEDAQEVAED